MSKVIILDGGHGVDCAGKRSPIWGDGSQLFEWEFNRDIVRRIAAMLKADGVKFEILVPEDNDVSLPERCRRANVIHADCGNNAVLFSVHGNAGGGTGRRTNESGCNRNRSLRRSGKGVCPGRLENAFRLYRRRPGQRKPILYTETYGLPGGIIRKLFHGHGERLPFYDDGRRA